MPIKSIHPKALIPLLIVVILVGSGTGLWLAGIQPGWGRLPQHGEVTIHAAPDETTAALASDTASAFDQQFWSLYGFALEDTTLADILAHLGATPQFEVPEEQHGGHHEEAICYLTSDDSVVVVFSTDEMGGGEDLQGVSLEWRSLHDHPCSQPNEDLAPLFPAGLRPGLTEAEFRELVPGEFTVYDSVTILRGSEFRRPIPKAVLDKRFGDPGFTRSILEAGGMADVTQVIIARFAGGRTTSITIWKSETF